MAISKQDALNAIPAPKRITKEDALGAIPSPPKPAKKPAASSATTQPRRQAAPAKKDAPAPPPVTVRDLAMGDALARQAGLPTFAPMPDRRPLGPDPMDLFKAKPLPQAPPPRPLTEDDRALIARDLAKQGVKVGSKPLKYGEAKTLLEGGASSPADQIRLMEAGLLPQEIPTRRTPVSGEIAKKVGVKPPKPVEMAEWNNIGAALATRGKVIADAARRGATRIGQLQAVANKDATDIASLNADLAQIPASAQTQAMMEPGGNWWQAFTKDPVEITMEVITESLAQYVPELPSMAASATLGPAALGANVARVAGAQQYAQTYVDAIQRAGVDTSDPDAVRAFFADPAMVSKAQKEAAKDGIIAAAFNGITGAFAGKATAAAAKGFLSKAGGFAKDVGVQAAGGMGDEAARQLVRGGISDPASIFLEGIAELGSGSAEVAVGAIARGAKNAFGATNTEAMPPRAETLMPYMPRVTEQPRTLAPSQTGPTLPAPNAIPRVQYSAPAAAPEVSPTAPVSANVETAQTNETAPAPAAAAGGIVPPLIKGMTSNFFQAVEEMRDSIDVTGSGIEGGNEYITFTLNGKAYKGTLLGRNKDLVIGFGNEQDKAIALRTLLDKDAVEIGSDPTKPPAPTFAKGDTVTLPDGTTGTITTGRVNSAGRIAVKTDDGKIRWGKAEEVTPVVAQPETQPEVQPESPAAGKPAAAQSSVQTIDREIGFGNNLKVDDFYATYSPQQAGKVRKALSATISVRDNDGKIISSTVKDEVDAAIAAGSRVALTATGPALVDSNMRGYSADEIGAFGMEYANWLLSNKESQVTPQPAAAEVIAPTPAEVKKASKTEKINKKTGLTSSQEEYLAKHLQKAVEDVPRLTEDQAKRGLYSPEQNSKFADPVTIKVPGDGQFTVFNPLQASTLHQQITGKPLAGISTNRAKPSSSTSSYDADKRYKEAIATASSDAVQLYGGALNAVRKLSAQLENIVEYPDRWGKIDTNKLRGVIDNLANEAKVNSADTILNPNATTADHKEFRSKMASDLASVNKSIDEAVMERDALYGKNGRIPMAKLKRSSEIGNRIQSLQKRAKELEAQIKTHDDYLKKQNKPVKKPRSEPAAAQTNQQTGDANEMVPAGEKPGPAVAKTEQVEKTVRIAGKEYRLQLQQSAMGEPFVAVDRVDRYTDEVKYVPLVTSDIERNSRLNDAAAKFYATAQQTDAIQSTPRSEPAAAQTNQQTGDASKIVPAGAKPAAAINDKPLVAIDAPIPLPKATSKTIANLAKRAEDAITQQIANSEYGSSNGVAIGDNLIVRRRGKTQWEIVRRAWDEKAMTRNKLGSMSRTGGYNYELVAKGKDLAEIIRSQVVPENAELWGAWEKVIRSQREKAIAKKQSTSPVTPNQPAAAPRSEPAAAFGSTNTLVTKGEAPAGGGRSVANTAAETINATIPKEYPAGNVTTPVTRTRGQIGDAPTSAPVTFTDAETESRYRAATEGVKPPSRLELAREWTTKFFNKATRTFEKLPNIPKYAQVHFELRRLLRTDKAAIGKRVVHYLQYILLDQMTPEQHDLFRRKVIVDDLVRSAERGESLPFGFTEESVRADKVRVDEAVDADAVLKDAIDRRARVWGEIKAELIASAEAVGDKALARQLTREDYYRHIVLDYAQLKAVAGAGKQLRQPTGSGYRRSRHGSERDISANYLQTEFEVMAQMLMDARKNTVIKKIGDQHDMSKVLKRRAKDLNFQELVGGPEIVARIRELEAELAELYANPEEAQESYIRQQARPILEELNKLDPTRPYKKKMAMGFAKLEKTGVMDEMDIDGELSGALMAEVARVANDNDSPGQIAAKTILKAIADKEQMIKDTLGSKYLTWKQSIDARLIPDTHVSHQFREGNLFYKANAIPSELVTTAMEAGLDELGVPADKVREVLAKGQRYPEMILPSELSETLNDLQSVKNYGPVEQAFRTTTQAWKQYTLLNPRRLLKYNLRNLSGDFEALIRGNARAIRFIPQAAIDLYQIFKTNRAPEGLLAEWIERGGTGGLMQAQEMGEVEALGEFARLMEKKRSVGPLAVAPIRGYWKAARLATDYREAILRYAAFMEYADQIRKSPTGKPRSYGASLRQNIDALTDPLDRAYALANDLLGAYDEITALGQELREKYAPFWSWAEVNAKREYRLLRNAFDTGNVAGYGVKKLAFASAKVLRYAIGTTLALTALSVYNNWRFPDEEEELPEDVRKTPHLVLGRNPDGTVRYFSRLGAVSDFLAWFGLDSAPSDVRDILNGRMTVAQWLANTAKAPAQKLIDSANPVYKTAVELITGRSLYPDATARTPVRDPGMNVARALSVENEYAALTGRPQRDGKYSSSYENLTSYTSDPLESAYWDTISLKYKYQELQGEQGFSPEPTEKGTALWQFKRALRYNDTRAAKKYFAEYIAKGGSLKGFEKSMTTTDPEYGLSTEKGERRKFERWLSPTEKEKLARAKGYHRMLTERKKALMPALRALAKNAKP